MVRFDQPYIDGIGIIKDYGTNATTNGNGATENFITGISAETFGFSNNLDICNNLMVHGDAEISGNTNIYGTLDVSSNAIFKNSVDIYNNLLIHDSLDISNNLDVSGSTVIDGNLTVKTTINDGSHNVYDESAVSFGDSPDFYIINDFLYNSISQNISSTDLSSVGLILTKNSFGIADNANVGGKSLAGTLSIKDKWYINTTFQHDGSGGVIFSNSIADTHLSQVSAFITNLNGGNQLKIAWFNSPASSDLSGIMRCNPEPYMYNLEIIKEESPNNTDPSYITVNLNEISNNIIINSEKKVISLNPELDLNTTFNIHLGLPNEKSVHFDDAICDIQNYNYKLTVSKFIFANNSDFNPTPSLVTRGNCITANKIIARDSLHVLNDARFHKNVTINQDCTVIGNLEVDDYLKIYGDVSTNGYVLDVSGNSYFRNNVDISGDTHLNGILDVSGTADIADTLTLSKASGTGLSVTKNASIGGNLEVEGTLEVDSTADIAGTLKLTKATGDELGLSVTKNASIGGDLEVTGDLSGGGLYIAGNSIVGAGGNANFNIKSHDGTQCGLRLNDTLVTATASELNILDGSTTQLTVTLDGDEGVVISHGNVMKQCLVSDFFTYIADLSGSDNNFTNQLKTKFDGIDVCANFYELPSDVQRHLAEGAFVNGDKTKLNNIATNANNYSLTNTGNGSVDSVCELSVVSGDSKICTAGAIHRKFGHNNNNLPAALTPDGAGAAGDTAFVLHQADTLATVGNVTRTLTWTNSWNSTVANQTKILVAGDQVSGPWCIKAYRYYPGNTFYPPGGLGSFYTPYSVTIPAGWYETDEGEKKIITESSTDFSDDRLKHNESNIENALTTINKLKPQTYIMTEEFYDASHNLDLSNLPNDAFVNSGYIAQEVLEIPELKHLITANTYMTDNSGIRLRDSSNNLIPSLYKTNKRGEYQTYSLNPLGVKVIDPSGTLYKESPIGINYDGMQPYLTKAIQELHVLVLEQSATISTLQSQNSALEARLSALENN